MRFSLFVPFHRLDASEPIEQVYADALEQIVFADEAGFDTVWFPEHHLSSMIVCPRPLTAVAWAAQHTRRIRLGTGILVLPYYHPLTLAEEIGMVDALSGGRLEVGIGRGGYNHEYTRFDITEQEASERTRECIEAVLQLWGDQDLPFAGTYWSYPESSAVPKPIQRPHPPIWMAARSPDSVRWAVEHGFNLMATPQRESFSRVEGFIANLRRLEAEIRPTRRPRLAVSRMTYVTDDPADARDAMHVVWKNHCINRHLHVGDARVWQGQVEPDPLSEQETLSTETLLENLIVGEPDVCIRKLRQYEEAGIDHFLVYADLGFEQERIMRSLGRFVREVMPHFVKTPTAVG